MSSRQRLEQYLDSLRTRIRTLIYTRAAAAGVAGVVLLSALWVWMLDREGFPSQLAAVGRVLLVVLLAAVALALVWRPLRKLGRNNGADEIERRLPAQHGRIETYLDMQRREAEGISSPLLDLLAGDAAKIAETTPVAEVIPGSRIWIGAAIASAAAILLISMLAFGPGYWGYGTRHFLLGASLPRDAVPLRRVVVAPGNATVRRNSDLAIRATVEGFKPDEAQVFVRFDDEKEWQEAPMQVVQESNRVRWEFKLYAVRGPLHYYVRANTARSGEKSTEHSIGVVDLPHVERVRLTYNYPEWTGLEARTEENYRDIRAVQGTNVKLEVFANAPLEFPLVVVDGEQAELSSAGGSATGNIQVKKPGSYRISARVANELVALTDDYAIEIVNDEKPTINIEKPGRDWHASSIEEVPVRINAEDDFRLRDVELRYAVNGGAWHKMDVGRAGKQVRSESLLKLEELGSAQAKPAPNLQPGDLVTYYAVARDEKQNVQTDLFMVQVQPFERRFKQGQGGGGGGGDGEADEQGAISERQREILLATWNLQRSDNKATRSRKQLEESAEMLADMQSVLAQQARTLSERTRARMSLDEDERIKQFVQSLDSAADAMEPAAKHLKEFKLEQAVPIEQQALQQLLRAEAAFREVQVSMQRDNSGNGGAQAARNFTEMFELEMDVDKNHYETESQLAKENKKEELDEAVRKLKELAERQEKLAQEAQRQAIPEREQRWRQEQLRREAEDLRRRLAELQRSQSSSQSNNPNASQGAQSGEQSGDQVANALDSMRQALDQMRAAGSEKPGSQSSGSQNSNSQSPGSAAQSAREASRKLQQALDQIGQGSPQGLAETLEQLASRTEKLSNQQRKVETDLHKALSQNEGTDRRRGQLDPQQTAELTETKQAMAQELQDLQHEMRNAAHDYRSKQPEATQRLGEIVNDLEGANIVSRINRSASEIQYGRARDAASREGLIADVLESLEKSLRETAQAAAREGQQNAAGADPETILAQLSELRRALQEAQQKQSGAGRQPGQSQQSQQGTQPGQGQGQGQEPGQSEQQAQTASNQGSTSTSGSSASGGLGAWNPSAPGTWRGGLRNGFVGPLETNREQFRRDASQVAERVQSLADRIDASDMSLAEINALRRMAHELRSLAGNPMAAQTQAMAKLVDQIELATLAAAKSRNATPAHTSTVTAEEPQYRESVAEYYRRLGGS